MRTLSLIQVGAGLWGRSWAEVAHGASGFRLAALVDAAPAAREWVAAELGVPAFPRLDRALDSVAADAVLLVSPPATHRPLAEAALAAGLHVLSEKPFALTLADARAVALAGARAKREVMVAQNYRFRRQPRALQQLVATDALGSLLGVRIACRRDLRNAWISSRDWRGKMAHPYLLDMAIHHVDMLRQITGREIAQVDARAWRVPDSPFRNEPAVEALLTLDDGTPVAYEGTWAATTAETSWNGDWELVGEQARATWSGGVDDPLRGIVDLERYGSKPERVALPRLAAVDRLGVLRELRRALAEGAPPETLPRGQPEEPQRDLRDRALGRERTAGSAVKIGLFLALFHDRTLEEALDVARAAGCEAVEISTTGPHRPDREAAERRGLEISALSCHGNPLHPDGSVAAAADRSFRETVRLAAEIGVETVITFSGCPGESGHSCGRAGSRAPGRTTFRRRSRGSGASASSRTGSRPPTFAREHGVRVAIEPHPGFVVYNTATMLRLREAAGENVGANFDPSHLFWQQIDPLASARALDGAIFHVHAKDTGFDADRLALNGVLETGTDTDERAWIFRTVGDGHRSSSGATSSPRCATPATTARSRSSTRIRFARARTASSRAVATLRAALS